jgi:hypothetical protein
VPYATPVPLLALELHVAPTEIVVAHITRGTIVIPATRAVHREYILDANDHQVSLVRIPAGFHASASNRSWRVYVSC